MNRRELIKAIVPLAATPVIVKGQEVGKAFSPSDQRFLVFLNGNILTEDLLNQMCDSKLPISPPLPAGTPLYIVCPWGEQTMDDVVRIYKV